jgi:hypothetical protein
MLARVVLVLALAAAGPVHAQLKPPADLGAAPIKPATTPAADSDPVARAKEEAAGRVAGEWLKLIDSGEYGKAWDQCAPVFREKVTRDQWVQGIPKSRADYGKFNSRKLVAAAYRTSLPGAPEGDFVTVRFASDFEKNAAAEELVTLMYQGGSWRPIGYLLR